MTFDLPKHDKKLALVLLTAVLVGLGVLLLAPQGGCVAKPGAAMTTPDPVSIEDPSYTQGKAVIGENTTSVAGPLGTETSKLDTAGLAETNTGSALKQRAGFAVGDLKAMMSAASDFDLAGIKATFTPEGKVASVEIAKLATSNSAVQRAVNEGVALLVGQWQRSSDNERAVLEKQLDTQAAAGNTLAQAAVAAIKAAKAAAGVPPIPALPSN